jgi:hypothetical protein
VFLKSRDKSGMLVPWADAEPSARASLGRDDEVTYLSFVMPWLDHGIHADTSP